MLRLQFLESENAIIILCDLNRAMAQDIGQRAQVAAVKQIEFGETMPESMRIRRALDTRLLCPPREHLPDTRRGKRRFPL